MRDNSTALIAKPKYEEHFSVARSGLAQSLETTTWQGSAIKSSETLDAACKIAAESYVIALQKISLGLLGTRAHAPTDRQTIFFRPLNIKLMAFSPVHKADDNEYYVTVDDGFFCSRYAEQCNRGRLYFRWHQVDQMEVFQTEVRDYTSRLVGKNAFWVTRFFYTWTQMLAHRIVSWRFHKWVQNNRTNMIEMHKK